MNCPRDNIALNVETQLGIEVDHCPACNGRWLDAHELDQLEATVESTEAERRATIEYGEIKSELKCPKCDKQMTQFNYRAYDLELDTCPDGHGYWLDAGEGGRVRDIIAERVRDLARSADAEAGWSSFLGGLRGGKKKGLFGR
jgi:Zn-finger nucleic acid-binding protein